MSRLAFFGRVKRLHRISRPRLRTSGGQPSRLALRLGLQLAVLTLALWAPQVHAQSIATYATTASTNAMTAFGYILNAFCFIGGGGLLAMSIFGWWQHQRNPNAGGRMGMVIAGFVCGGLLLAFPMVAGTASFSIFGSGPSVTGQSQQMTFSN